MKPIDGIELSDIVKDAAELEFQAAVTTVRDKVRQLYQKKRGAAEEVAKLHKQLKKAEESLRKTSERIEQVRAGKWELLNEDQSNSNKEAE